MNIDFMHFGTEIQRKRGFLSWKEPFTFARNMEEKNGFSFQGRNHTAQQNRPNYDYKQKKPTFRTFRTYEKEPHHDHHDKDPRWNSPQQVVETKSCREKQLQF